MIVDIRCYSIAPRKMKQYLETFEQYALPVQERNGLRLLGYFVHTSGTLNKVTHMWGYDSLADLEAKRAKRDADPGWADYMARSVGLVEAQENNLTTPAPFSPIK